MGHTWSKVRYVTLQLKMHSWGVAALLLIPLPLSLFSKTVWSQAPVGLGDTGRNQELPVISVSGPHRRARMCYIGKEDPEC